MPCRGQRGLIGVQRGFQKPRKASEAVRGAREASTTVGEEFREEDEGSEALGREEKKKRRWRWIKV